MSLLLATRHVPLLFSVTRHSLRGSLSAAGLRFASGRPEMTTTKATDLLKSDIPKAEDPMLHFLASLIMRHGERHKASKVVSLMLQHIRAMTSKQPMEVFRTAVLMAAPSVRVVSRRQGAMKTTMSPVGLSERQRTRQAFLWILHAQMSRPGARLSERLAREIVAIFIGNSPVLSWKDQCHAQAMVNRAAVRIPPPWELR
ncbi:ribosomal protein S7 domain-containing protein [Auriculariales sp. MPI-PUGE-AT-0066]|nr:ribosomal protein S7 domain-containing protein [Auriculariales sp. MPI-PUGE-AT-0066]